MASSAPEALGDRRDRDGAGRFPAQEILPAGHGLRLHPGAREQLDQHLAPPRRLGAEQLAPRLRQRRDRGDARDRIVALAGLACERQFARAEVVRAGALGLLQRRELDAGVTLERRAQFIGRQEDLGGREQRAGDIGAETAVAAVYRLPHLVDPGTRGILDAEQALSGQIIEQRGALVEEQRQEVLDAARRDAARDILVVGAGTVVVVEALVPAAAERRDRRIVEGVLAPGQQAQALERRERALGLGVETAQRLDLVVEQLDAHRGVVSHREQVHDGAAHRELAVLVDIVDGAVAGARRRGAGRGPAPARRRSRRPPARCAA